jgi:integrative and conjugative element protein (TIGR02256 family)
MAGLFRAWRSGRARRPTEPLIFKAPSGLFGLSIPVQMVERILGYCARALPNETGGILIGRYSASFDMAVVSEATPAPRDSRAGRNWFYRGTQGLLSLLDEAWKDDHHYLGEWHFHPLADPTPSETDRRQLRDIARDEKYHCAEPLLLIVGGHPQRNWLARAYVFPRTEPEIELLSQSVEPS